MSGSRRSKDFSMSMPDRSDPNVILKAVSYTAWIREIIFSYGRLTTKYVSLPLAQRRAITPDAGLERFYCAALFEWQANAQQLDQNRYRTLGYGTERPEDDRALPIDEHCPAAHGWFKELFQAQEAIWSVRDGEHSHEQLSQVRDWLDSAWWAYLQAEEWLGAMMAVAPPATDDRPVEVTLLMWNLLCSDIKDWKLPLESALRNADTFMKSRPNVPLPSSLPIGRSGRRFWFEVELPRQPYQNALKETNRPQASGEGQAQ